MCDAPHSTEVLTVARRRGTGDEVKGALRRRGQGQELWAGEVSGRPPGPSPV